MKETHETLKTVLRQIEAGTGLPEGEELPPDEDFDLDGELDTEQVMAILLGRRKTAQAAAPAPNPADRLAPLAQLNYYMPLPEGRSPVTKLSTLIKRIIRKLIRPIMLPIVDSQSRFNTAAVQAVDSLYRETEALREELQAEKAANRRLRRRLAEGEKKA